MCSHPRCAVRTPRLAGSVPATKTDTAAYMCSARTNAKSKNPYKQSSMKEEHHAKLIKSLRYAFSIFRV